MSAYVEQDVALIGSLSVKETLHFSGRLAVSSSTGSEQRQRLVTDLLHDFGLSGKLESKRLGTTLGGNNGLSGGEKKRLAIAAQLVTKPQLLFLDEPTSGLDATAALEVMSRLKTIAKRDKMIIIASIHQPSRAVFETFGSLFLFHRSGRQIFSGPVSNIVPGLDILGRDIPSDAHLAEALLDIANEPLGCEIPPENCLPAASVDTFIDSRWLKGATPSRAHPPRILATLMHRAFLKSFRDVTAYGIRAAMYLCLALLMGTVWLRLQPTDRNIQAFVNAIFFGGAFMSFMAVAYVPAFLEDHAVFLREQANGLYGPLVFVVANFLTGLPFLFAFSVLFSSITYWLSNFRPSLEGYLIWVFWLFLDLVAAESLVVLVSSTVPIFVASLALTAFLNGVWMCTGGFLVHASTLNPFWKYVFHYIDYQSYVFQGMMVNEFRDRKYSCIANDDAVCSCLYEVSSSGSCVVDGHFILGVYKIEADRFARRAAALLGIVFALRLLTWLVLGLGCSIGTIGAKRRRV